MKKTLDIFAIVVLCLFVYVVSAGLAIFAISDYKEAAKIGLAFLVLLIIAWSAIRGGEISYRQEEEQTKRKQHEANKKST